MNYFEIQENSLIYRYNGETVRIKPWGNDSFRVESVFLGDIPEGEIALLPLNELLESANISEKTSTSKSEYNPLNEAGISITDDTHASITNGLIRAELKVEDWWKNLQISFVNSKTGKLLLKEISNGNALALSPRTYIQQNGGGFEIKQSFISDPNEKIYGMGQYQAERMNLKGTTLELAHRNSQCSIPFYVSSLGYGFLWHNAAIGSVTFGLDTTTWYASCSQKIDYYITAGNTPSDIVSNYMKATGLPPMMPEFGLGFWQCKLRYY
ncbi:MAG: glycoside hydrolase family 31 protein, partial [Butyrivibrio sp.]|nr:glycoside hydrolase family 31 protein [Butyrivibrio sp.]